MMLKETDRACVCSWCGRLVKIKRDNTISSHKSSGCKCDGSGTRATDEIKVAKAVEKDVHTEHCCVFHGCKYGHADCPVEKREKPQSYPCEYCSREGMDPTSVDPETSIYYFKPGGYYRRLSKKVLFDVEKYPKELLYVMDYLIDASLEVNMIGCFFYPTPFLPTYTVRFTSEVKGVKILKHSEWIEITKDEFEAYKEMYAKQVTIG